MIELKDIRKSYKTGDFVQTALDGVSISLRDNEFVAVLGPSGSGKTTFLNVVGGLDHADSGDLVINGVSTKDYKSADWDTYRNHHIGFIFQSYNLIPHQTSLANVELALTLSGISKAERRQRAKAELERVGLGPHIHKKPSQLSGGQMQRVAIARALVNDPDIVLADEPTGALDTETGIQVMDLLSEIASDRLVVMVTHNPELAYEYANRIVNIHDGKIVGDSNPFDPGFPTPAGLSKHAAAAPAAVTVTSALNDRLAPEDHGKTAPLGVIYEPEISRDATGGSTGYGTGRSGASKGKKKHSSMSFLTALALSFNNLMTKKGRTFLTAFAGSIVIIGIAAILALSNGVNNYIAKVQENTLSSSPLTITKSSFDITSVMTAAGTYSAKGDETAEQEDGVIPESTIMADVLSDIKNNDLKSFRKYLESGESDVYDHVNAIVYDYGITPLIYSSDTSNGVKQLNPGTLTNLMSNQVTSSMSMFSAMGGNGAFQEMLDDPKLLSEQYDVVAGTWPTSYNECVLVLSESGGLSDYTYYAMGVLDPDKLEDMLSDAISDEHIDVPDTSVEFTYDDALSTSFKVVPASSTYALSEDGKTWVSKSDDENFMEDAIANGIDLKVVGIIQPKPTATSTSLTEGIGYRSDLPLHLMDVAAESDIVKQQIDDPDVDVFTGETFEKLKEDSGADFDMSQLFTVDEAKMANAFQVDTSSIESAMTNAMGGAASGMNTGDMFSDVPLPDFNNLDLSAIQNATAETQAQQAQIMQTAATNAMPRIMQDYMTWSTQQGGAPGSASYEDYQATGRPAQIFQEEMAAASASAGYDPNAAAQQLQTAFGQAIQNAMADYMANTFTPYLQAKMGDTLAEYSQNLAVSMASALGDAMGSGVSFNAEEFANAITVNMDQDELTNLLMNFAQSGNISYEKNLSKLGYASIDEPQSINIYAKSFDDKQAVEDIISVYNDDMDAQGEPDKSISYSDIMGALMKSVTDIVNMISMVLIAFVAISLVVSSIMIGIITYISVLERKKEIGILRAMGASKGNVANIFNAETFIEGLMSGIFAIAVVMLVSIPINAYVLSWRNVENIMSLPMSSALILVCISVFLTFVSGLIPAMNAARRDPVEALRSE